MTVTREAIAVPDSTGPTVALLRTLRRGRARKQAASVAYWIYLAGLVVAFYGGAQIAAAYHALRHPPLPTAQTPRMLHAAPAGLTALALLVLLVLLRDALWRGPVTLPQPAVDWLLGTPVDRGRLLRPRFRGSAAATVVAGAAVGIVPAAALVALGLGGHSVGHVLRLTGVAVISTGAAVRARHRRRRPDRAVSGQRALGAPGHRGRAVPGRGARRAGRLGGARPAARRADRHRAVVGAVGLGRAGHDRAGRRPGAVVAGGGRAARRGRAGRRGLRAPRGRPGPGRGAADPGAHDRGHVRRGGELRHPRHRPGLRRRRRVPPGPVPDPPAAPA